MTNPRWWAHCRPASQNFVKSSPNFSKLFINFCIQSSIFQHFSKSTHFCKILQKILQNFAKFLRISENFAKFCKTCQKMSKFLENFAVFLAEICRICSREDDFLVDFEKCCKMRIWTRKSASIQKRTSPLKFDHLR